MWKKQILKMQTYKRGKSINEAAERSKTDLLIKLNSNENPYGYSNKVKDLLTERQIPLNIYPEGNVGHLRKSLASLYNMNETEFIFSNGTDELIQMISRTLLEPGKNTVMASQTFSQYKNNSIIDGAEIREVELLNGTHDLEKMITKIDQNTAVVWVCNPNNPTGTFIPENKIREFMQKIPSHVLVVLDEAYFEYINQAYHSIDLINDFANLIIMRTFSKIYGLASLRIGYGIASHHIIQHLESIRLPFTNNQYGQHAASLALEDQAFIESSRLKNVIEREKYYTFCSENNLHCFPSETNFILVDLQCDIERLEAFLESSGIILRSGTGLGFPTSIRITIGLEEQNIKVREKILEFMQNHHQN
ncbi:histidinol-phosphate transaminase [Cytobacillus purgationiresistens]|uniref:Histidinol-phosphate aminotransferase n=1 Tax=Cytobacillus purgationiresistens TaxID=863449 RepID=A0ABU0ALA6_9BACI|nr:histidinol-phosphate transaminase [Cytobacillus purgationiresistens]MDQ0272053.1 histidinol-phosphate aminotransferase [Cytobacillus purgationiresistens]